jgi:hypothetical protein
MVENSDEKLMNLVNTSGFPFQIAISNLVKERKDEHGWSVFSSEAPWDNPVTGRSGYIDLILQNSHDTQLMVIECKRVRDARWVFLVPSKRQLDRRHGILGLSYIKKDKSISVGMTLILIQVPLRQNSVLSGARIKIINLC